MQNAFIFRQLLLLVTILMLSGCILVPVDDGHSRSGHHENRHDSHGDRHDGPGGHR